MYGVPRGAAVLHGLAGLQAGAPVRDRLARVVGVRRWRGGGDDAVLFQGRGLRRARGARRLAAQHFALRGRRHLARQSQRASIPCPRVRAGPPAPAARRGSRSIPRFSPPTSRRRSASRSSRRASHGSTAVSLPARLRHRELQRDRVPERPLRARGVRRRAHLVRKDRLRRRREPPEGGGRQGRPRLRPLPRRGSRRSTPRSTRTSATASPSAPTTTTTCPRSTATASGTSSPASPPTTWPCAPTSTSTTSSPSRAAATRACSPIQTSAFDPAGNGGVNCSNPPCYSPYTNYAGGGYFPSNGHPFDEGVQRVRPLEERRDAARGARRGQLRRRGRPRRRRHLRRADHRDPLRRVGSRRRLAVGRQAAPRAKHDGLQLRARRGLPVHAAVAGRRRVGARRERARG
jgi:hypothetical protein